MLTKKYLMMVGLLKRDYNAKITKMEGKIPSIFGLVTSTALTAVGNKTPDVIDPAKKTD